MRLAKTHLRPYQESGVADALSALAKGATLLVAPTGSGKTVMAAEIASHYGSALIVAHRRELITQAQQVMGKHVVSMSVGRALNQGPENIDLLIIDEAHRADASTYRQIIAKYPNAARLGLTATPYRTDGRGLTDAFSEMVCVSSVKELVTEGHLVPYTALEAPDEALAHLKSLKKSRGDYDTKELSGLMNTPRLIGKVVDEYKRHALGIPAIAFGVSIEHSKAMALAFRKAGIRAVHIDGKTRKGIRDEVTEKLSSDKVDVVCNVNLFTEGWDCKEVACVIMARPTESLTLYLQCVGRGMRPDTASGKLGLIILDHAGNIARHGYPDEDRAWSLEGRGERERREAEQLKLQRLGALGYESLEQYELARQEQRRHSYSAKECDEIFGSCHRRSKIFAKHGLKRLPIGGSWKTRYLKSAVDSLADIYAKREVYSLEECFSILQAAAGLSESPSPGFAWGILKSHGIDSPSHGKYRRSQVDDLAATMRANTETTYSVAECAKLLGVKNVHALFRHRGVCPVSTGRYPKNAIDIIRCQLSNSYSAADCRRLLGCQFSNAEIHALMAAKGISASYAGIYRYDKEQVDELIASLPVESQSTDATGRQYSSEASA